MTDDTPAPGARSLTQRLLVGKRLYLRPVELADSRTGPIWRPRPFPAPSEVVEQQLKEQLEIEPNDEASNQLLIVCRRDSDQPVGSIRIRTGGQAFGQLSPVVDPLMPESRRDEIITEVIGFLVPWMIEERNLLSVIVNGIAGMPALERTVAGLSGRVAVHLRDRFLINGKRRDLLHYQILNPAWLETLGSPPGPTMGAIERQVASPAGPRIEVRPDERPPNAFAVGERIYLRPFKPEEGALVARWALEEPEIYYNEGRTIFNPVSYGHLHKMLAGKEMPGRIRFAIVLRETDEMIGANGLDHIDWVHRFAETETELFRPEHRSAGLGTAAKHLLLDYAFDRLGLHTISAGVDEANPRSAAALRKQGYREAGYVAWVSFKPGGMRGYWMFDLLASEWRAARQAHQP